ncbi:Uncharacterised protein [Candidatus Tiddalikarchaeum anstoanum]|nr:Uncharacterised protein [Candidatus Tiddalikarchaeum anstoanum]
MIEIRVDPLSKYNVIINETRAFRPEEYVENKIKTTNCLFCAGNENLTPPEISRVGTSKIWSVRVIPNKFPILTLQKFKELSEGVFESYKGHGNNEIIILTPNDDEHTISFPIKKWFECLKVYKERFEANSKLEEVEYVLIFHNEGSKAGASIKHSHSQVVALPFIPHIILNEAEGCSNQVCCNMINEELKSNRLVFKNNDFVVFTNFASRFPYETHIYPLMHTRSISNMTDDVLYKLAEALSVVMKAYSKLFKNMDFNFVLHNAPKNLEYHFHIEIYPQFNKYAGLEYGTGVIVNDVSPENSGPKLREAIK